MPAFTCSCGEQTNSACSNYFQAKVDNEYMPKFECYARMINGKWQKGCAYDRAHTFDRNFADKLITPQEEE